VVALQQLVVGGADLLAAQVGDYEGCVRAGEEIGGSLVAGGALDLGDELGREAEAGDVFEAPVSSTAASQRASRLAE
jgi:hypothetical protein